jgi:hypothetical protein
MARILEDERKRREELLAASVEGRVDSSTIRNTGKIQATGRIHVP